MTFGDFLSNHVMDDEAEFTIANGTDDVQIPVWACCGADCYEGIYKELLEKEVEVEEKEQSVENAQDVKNAQSIFCSLYRVRFMGVDEDEEFMAFVTDIEEEFNPDNHFFDSFSNDDCDDADNYCDEDDVGILFEDSDW